MNYYLLLLLFIYISLIIYDKFDLIKFIGCIYNIEQLFFFGGGDGGGNEFLGHSGTGEGNSGRSSFFHILIKIPTRGYSSEQLMIIFIKMQSDNTHLNFFVSCSCLFLSD